MKKVLTKVKNLLNAMMPRVYVFIVHLDDETLPTMETQLANRDVIPFINTKLGTECIALECKELDFYLAADEVADIDEVTEVEAEYVEGREPNKYKDGIGTEQLVDDIEYKDEEIYDIPENLIPEAAKKKLAAKAAEVKIAKPVKKATKRKKKKKS